MEYINLLQNTLQSTVHGIEVVYYRHSEGKGM
jgi:hypothetical protein